MNILRLLKRTPDVAVLLLANHANGTALSPSNARVVGIEAVGELETVAIIEARNDGSDLVNDPSIAQPYSGSQRFTYNRLRLSDFFGSTLRLPLRAPTNSQNIVEMLSINSGIVFDEHDIQDARFDGDVFTLHAGPNSRRWVGSLTIRLSD